jgi:uncharacterized protein
MSILSLLNFSNIAVENYQIDSTKVSDDYRFVHISDIQFGSVGKEYLDRVIELAIDQQPDFIVFTGDLIDFDYYKLEDFDIFKNIDVPIFFERGNHEFYHFPERIMEYLQTFSIIEVLDNKKVDFNDEITITGIDYNEQTHDNFKSVLSSIAIDTTKFNIQLFHSPEFVEYSAEQ